MVDETPPTPHAPARPLRVGRRNRKVHRTGGRSTTHGRPLGHVTPRLSLLQHQSHLHARHSRRVHNRARGRVAHEGGATGCHSRGGCVRARAVCGGGWPPPPVHIKGC